MNTGTEKIVLRGRKVIGGIAEGEALVSKKPLMGWGNVDEKRGFTTERNHPLYQVPFKGKVLVFPEPRGSGGFMGYGRTRSYGVNPAAFVYREGCALTVLAAMIANIPTVTDFDRDPIEIIETGDYVIVNGDEGIVEVFKGGLQRQT
ncbi:MAG: DUF126 domain-containing protein [Peptococcaceae bacterium]|nr:DUF126 domain-containing protein [Peptococcaceae bacterium]MDH7525779.1 DUF126 domain-containing protein [Peptococcaceae bacterium]